MLPGQYVYLPDGRHGQVLRMVNSQVSGPHSTVTPATLHIIRLTDGTQAQITTPHRRPAGWTQQEYVDRLHESPRLLPACKGRGCAALPGYPCVPACPVGDTGRVPAAVIA